MNWFDLVILVCSLSNPGQCAERHLTLTAEGTLAACSMQAPPLLAQWVGEHPDVRIARWRCTLPQMEAQRS